VPSSWSGGEALKTKAVVSQVEEVVGSVSMAKVAHFEDDTRRRPDKARGIAKAWWLCQGISAKPSKVEA
jgi:hypothetical protein